MPKAPKKIFGVNYLAPNPPEKASDRPKARKKIWPNLFGVGLGGCVVWNPPPPPPPSPLPPVVPSCEKEPCASLSRGGDNGLSALMCAWG